jgi:hypothetical protein
MLDLKKDGKELNAYLFISRPVDPKGLHFEAVHVILQYDEELATKMAVERTPRDYTVNPVSFIPVKRILGNINFIPPTPAPEKKPRATKKQFVCNLKLASERFIKNKADKTKLLKIIEKI